MRAVIVNPYNTKNAESEQNDSDNELISKTAELNQSASLKKNIEADFTYTSLAGFRKNYFSQLVDENLILNHHDPLQLRESLRSPPVYINQK